MKEQILDRTAVVGVIGLGYVGLPLAVESARSGYRTLGFDISQRLAESINRGESHIQDVSSEVLVTDHTEVDNPLVTQKARLVVGTRGVLRSHAGTAQLVGLSADASAAEQLVGLGR